MLIRIPAHLVDLNDNVQSAQGTWNMLVILHLIQGLFHHWVLEIQYDRMVILSKANIHQQSGAPVSKSDTAGLHGSVL